jgi:hypothetical protein
MKYSAYYNVNNGTTPASPIQSNNLRGVNKLVRDIVTESRYPGNTGWWYVLDDTGATMVCGRVDSSGRVSYDHTVF